MREGRRELLELMFQVGSIFTRINLKDDYEVGWYSCTAVITVVTGGICKVNYSAACRYSAYHHLLLLQCILIMNIRLYYDVVCFRM